ncbi:hypothetical protein [Actinoallomurus sp. NPDC050550]
MFADDGRAFAHLIGTNSQVGPISVLQYQGRVRFLVTLRPWNIAMP